MTDWDIRDTPVESGFAKTDREQMLLRSARLDVPSAAGQQHAIDVVLAEHRRSRAARSRRFGFALAAVLVFAVGGASLLRREAHAPFAAEPAATTVVPRPARPVPPRVLPPCPKVVIATGWPLLIDDMEDQNARVLLEDGRSGNWSLFSDGTGEVKPKPGGVLHPTRIPGGRGESQFGLHFAGGRFSGWGLTVNTGLMYGHCYDASIHAGVQFWARGRSRIRVGVRMIDVVEPQFGGLCERDCYNAHTHAIDLQPGWTHHSVRWDELQQAASSGRMDLDTRRLVSIDFGVYTADTPFDVWVDDVEFLPR